MWRREILFPFIKCDAGTSRSLSRNVTQGGYAPFFLLQSVTQWDCGPFYEMWQKARGCRVTRIYEVRWLSAYSSLLLLDISYKLLIHSLALRIITGDFEFEFWWHTLLVQYSWILYSFKPSQANLWFMFSWQLPVFLAIEPWYLKLLLHFLITFPLITMCEDGALGLLSGRNVTI